MVQLIHDDKPLAPTGDNGHTRRGNYVQSIQRAVAVLDTLSSSTKPLSTREIAALTGLDRTITHRILRTLEAEGLVDAGVGGFQLGGKTLLLGNAYLDHLNIRRVALPHTLSLLHGELAYLRVSMSLLVPVGAIVTIIDQLRSPNAPLDVILSVGTRFPIDRTAAGRCVLAYMPVTEVVALVGAERAAELELRLAAIRAANGVDYAQEDEPHGSPGIGALSALIRDRMGRSVACLSISGHDIAQHARPGSQLAPVLRRAADQIGLSLR
jgi:DNA-binding IclR family transcriptional regulator